MFIWSTAAFQQANVQINDIVSIKFLKKSFEN